METADISAREAYLAYIEAQIDHASSRQLQHWILELQNSAAYHEVKFRDRTTKLIAKLLDVDQQRWAACRF